MPSFFQFLQRYNFFPKHTKIFLQRRKTQKTTDIFYSPINQNYSLSFIGCLKMNFFFIVGRWIWLFGNFSVALLILYSCFLFAIFYCIGAKMIRFWEYVGCLSGFRTIARWIEKGFIKPKRSSSRNSVLVYVDLSEIKQHIKH